MLLVENKLLPFTYVKTVLEGFLIKYGFTESGAETITTYEIKLTDITAPSSGRDITLIPLKEASEHQWRAYRSKVDAMMKEDQDGYVLSLESKEFYDPDCSFIALSKDKKVAGAVLVDIDESKKVKKVHLDELRTFKDKSGEIALSLISGGVNALKKRFSAEAVIVASPATMVQKQIMDRLSDGKAVAVSDTVVYLLNLQTLQR